MRYEIGLDVDAITAIDMHVHVETDGHGHASLPPDLEAAASRYFKVDGPRPDVDSIADYYRARKMAAVIFTVDAEINLGHPPLSSAEIAASAAAHNDVLIPFGSVDPRRPDAVARVHALVEDAGVRGFKFHPTVQGFDPSDERYYPVFEAIRDAKVPALFHTGQTGIGAGMPGGRGFRLGLSRPGLLEPVAADFPDLQVIMAHPSVPWQDEALAIAVHKTNVWIDLSGWRPKYFPPELVRYANTLIKDRVLFGTDFPLLTPDRWLDDAQHVGFSADAMPGILRGNAMRLLGLIPRTETATTVTA